MASEHPDYELGRRRYAVAPVASIDPFGVRACQVGTALWAIAFLLLLPFSGRLSADGHLWLLWTCIAGVGLGLIGWDHTRRKAARAACD